MTIKFINENNERQSVNIKFMQNCTINNAKRNSIYEKSSYSIQQNKNKNIKLSNTQYKLITALAKGMYYDFCDAWDNDKVLTEDDLKMAYQRFNNGENIFGIKIKKFEYFEKNGVANITTESGETLNIDLETEFEKKYKIDNSLIQTDWKKNNKNQKSYTEWHKELMYQDYLHTLGNRESNNDYSRENSIGYLGRFQMGEKALIDVNFYTKDDTTKNDWKGNWTETAKKFNVNSKKSFLKNPKAQDHAIESYLKKQWVYIKHFKLDKSLYQEINGITITPAGLLAASHLVGVGKVIQYFKSNGRNIPHDDYGTSLEEYLKKFANYDVSNITGLAL